MHIHSRIAYIKYFFFIYIHVLEYIVYDGWIGLDRNTLALSQNLYEMKGGEIMVDELLGSLLVFIVGYSCGKWGADGEFGDCTEQAVEAFQRDHGIDATGIYDAPTRAAMEKALDEADEPEDEPRYVKIVGGNCYVRTAPNTDGKKLGVAHDGDVLPYGGMTSDNGWHLVAFKNQNGWVSGKYSRLVV